MNNTMSIFDYLYPKYKITKPIRLIEMFSGYGSQALALKYLGIPFEHWKICEWAVKSIQAYKDIHFTDDDTDFDEVCGEFPNTKSNGGKTSMPDLRDVGKKSKEAIGIDKLSFGQVSNVERKYSDYIAPCDSGSASRYFYCAKASKKDRDEGLDIEESVITDGRNKPIDNAFNRGETLRKNIHPTVKPTELMQYLVRLVTPNGATILDPFNGSGSTGKAVMYENKERNKGYKYIGIELTEEYLPIAKARIEYVCNLTQEEVKEQQMSIFDYIGE